MSALRVLEQVFPPPVYMSLPALGLDISDTSLKYIGFNRTHGGKQDLALKEWGSLDIPDGVVERGNVLDPRTLVSVLKEVKSRTKAEYVNVSLPEERAYLFETTLPRNTSRRNMRELIEFRLEENVPLSPRDAYFDFTIVGNDEETRELRAAVAVYAQSTIDNYYAACTEAELMPLAFEIEAQAIARASTAPREPGAEMIIDFGKTRMGIGIVYNGHLMYTSTVDVSGIELSTAMRTVLGDAISEDELSELKNTKGIVASKGNEAVARAFKDILKRMVDELGVRMHYWHTRKIDRGEREIQRIVLCGGSANLWGLPEYLSEALQIPTIRAEVWQNAFSLTSFVPPIQRKYSYGYATAIGLALRGFNL